MAYIKLDVNNAVIYKTPYNEAGTTEAPDSVVCGMVWDGMNYNTPPKPLAQARTTKLAQLEQARVAAERADVTVAGNVYPASESFQAKVSRAINQSGRGKPIAGANDAWRTADMQAVVMTAALLNQIEDAITAQSAVAWTRFGLRFDEVNAPNATVADIERVVW